MKLRLMQILIVFCGVSAARAATYPFGNYSYDGSGNVVAIGSEAYQYDAFGRIRKGTLQADRWQAYEYDRYGNITVIRTAGMETERRLGVDPRSNQIDNLSDPATNVFATYDDSGRMISYGGGNTFAYDALDAVTTIKVSQREKQHLYNASDERVGTIDVLTGEQLWTVRDAAGQVLRRFRRPAAGEALQWSEDYVYRDGRMLAAYVPDGEKIRHFHLDHLGSPRLITGNGGAKIAESRYYPFGEEVQGALQTAEAKQFTGHERDRDSLGAGGDLDYMHARYYGVGAGRFLSPDPGNDSSPAQPQSWNSYQYARNNPVLNTDPNGRVCYPCVGALVGATIGTIAGGAYETYRVAVKHEPVNNKRIVAFAAMGAVLGAELGLNYYAEDISPPTENEPRRPTEAYDRQKHYGRTPTRQDRKDLGAGPDEVVNHEPPLVKRFYEGDPAIGEKPGYQMTPEERRASANDRSRMNLQPKKESCQQGRECAQYSQQKKRELELSPPQ